MVEVRVEIIEYSDNVQPGLCKCRFLDAWGLEWTVVDKLSIFTASSLDFESHYPQPGSIRCQVIRKWQDADGREIITIDTSKPDYVRATTGETRFDVLFSQISES